MQEQPFRLLDLPAEIYLAILALHLVYPGPICLHPAKTSTKTSNTGDVRPPALSWRHLITPPPIARTNCLLRAESLRLFYTRNTFHGLNWRDPRPQEWLARIPMQVRAGFQTSFLLSTTWSAEDLASFLGATFEGLKGRVEVWEGGDEAVVEKLRVCEDVEGGRVFVVRFL